MNQEQPTVSYDDFFLKPDKERLEIFNEITAENRALIVKTQSERWLAANRSRLNNEQIVAVEAMIHAISPDWYKTDRNFEEINPEVEAMVKKVEAVLSPDDVKQLATRRAEYIPVVEDEND